MGTPNAYTLTAQVTSRPNVPTTWTARTEYFNDEFGGWRWDASTGIAIRPASQWQASVDPTYSHSVDGRQYVTTRAGGSAATFGKRYVFSFIERSTLSARFRLNYAFTPNFTVEAYAEPFAASGRFYDFGELPAPRSRDAARRTARAERARRSRATRRREHRDATARRRSRCRRSISIACRSARISCCDGSGCRAARRF